MEKQIKCPNCDCCWIIEIRPDRAVQWAVQYESVECRQCRKSYVVRILFEPRLEIFRKEDGG